MDVSELYQNGDDSLKDTLKRQAVYDQKDDPTRLDQFLKLLFGINMYIGRLYSDGKNNLLKAHKVPAGILDNKMNVERADKMTRTALVVAYYYNHANEAVGARKSFVDVCYTARYQRSGGDITCSEACSARTPLWHPCKL